MVDRNFQSYVQSMFKSQFDGSTFKYEGGENDHKSEIEALGNTIYNQSTEKLLPPLELPPLEGKKRNYFESTKKSYNVKEEIQQSREKYLIWIALDREVDLLKGTMRIYNWTNTHVSVPIIDEVYISLEKNSVRPKQSHKFTDHAKFNLSDSSCCSGTNKGYLPNKVGQLPKWSDVQDGIIREQKKIILEQLITIDLQLKM